MYKKLIFKSSALKWIYLIIDKEYIKVEFIEFLKIPNDIIENLVCFIPGEYLEIKDDYIIIKNEEILEGMDELLKDLIKNYAGADYIGIV